MAQIMGVSAGWEVHTDQGTHTLKDRKKQNTWLPKYSSSPGILHFLPLSYLQVSVIAGTCSLNSLRFNF